MRKINTYPVLFILLLLITLSSCNVSLSILNRKYRPGFSFLSSHKQHNKKNDSKEEVVSAKEPSVDSLEVNVEDNIVASSNNSELILNNHNIETVVVPCDTPPKKIMDDPDFSLYKEKKPDEVGAYKGRILEPYGLLAIIFLALGFFITSILEFLSVWIFLFVFFSVFIMSIISLVKMKKHPGKYMRVFRVTNWIFLGFYILGLFILLAA